MPFLIVSYKGIFWHIKWENSSNVYSDITFVGSEYFSDIGCSLLDVSLPEQKDHDDRLAITGSLLDLLRLSQSI